MSSVKYLMAVAKQPLSNDWCETRKVPSKKNNEEPLTLACSTKMAPLLVTKFGLSFALIGSDESETIFHPYHYFS